MYLYTFSLIKSIQFRIYFYIKKVMGMCRDPCSLSKPTAMPWLVAENHGQSWSRRGGEEEEEDKM